MAKTYYLFNPGRLSRKDNTLRFVPVDEDGQEGPPKYIPVEDVENLYVFGALDVNSALLNFLGKHRVMVHFFDYYEHYTGSFMPKEYLLAGKMVIAQTEAYLHPARRLALAQKFVSGGAVNMLHNLRYYHNRQKEMGAELTAIEKYLAEVPNAGGVEVLMGLEGNIRQVYYQAFDKILDDFVMAGRSRQPPTNEVNALVSFGNMLCYTLCLDQLYHTQLHPTISFLHQPGTRRYSLALDLAEVFKPVLVDRMIFSVLNKKQLQAQDFDQTLNGTVLKDKGRKALLKIWDERLKETLQHPQLKRKVSYKHLVRLEAYKVAKHLLGMDDYRPYKMR
ncbi:MAG: type I-B CRISPR-associated endonuclease Cas1 [Microscillaceae bacterium]|nr:type I-B CRISPR-associated endonuclease Cas1 [Microscillaceae bacterium]